MHFVFLYTYSFLYSSSDLFDWVIRAMALDKERDVYSKGTADH